MSLLQSFGRRATSLAGIGALALTGLTAACADAPTAPAAPEPAGAPSRAVLTTAATANVLTRTTPLSRAVQASAVIGKEGGTLSMAATGLTLVVPAGAVSQATTFTIVAPAGGGVWYDFGPSGAKFAVPLTIRQDLRATNMNGLNKSTFEGAYFVDGSMSESTKTAKVTEVLPVTFNSTGTELTFKVTHFSGYMVSTGRSR